MRARGFQELDVAGMEQIEAAVGEDHALSVAFRRGKPQNNFVKFHYCGVQRVSMLAYGGVSAKLCEIQVYHAASKAARGGRRRV